MARTVTVHGIGNLTKKPDSIVISLLLSTFNHDYNATIENATDKLARLNKAVTEAGFAKNELKTSSFDVEAVHDRIKDQYGNYKKRYKGYNCKQRMTIRFDFDMARLNQAMLAITQVGIASDFDIGFTVKDLSNISTELLANAAKNAEKKAKVLCETLQGKLGTLQSINYNWGEIDIYSSTSVKNCLCCDGMSKSIDIEPEEVEFSDTATFVWEIE